MTKNKKIILILLILGIMSIAGYGYYMYNKSVETLENVAPDVSTTASDLTRAYTDNESASNTIYLNKVISVEGIINKIEKEDGITIYLKTDDPFSQVACKLNNQYTTIDYQINDPISIKGLCTGYLMDVLLVNATIIK